MDNKVFMRLSKEKPSLEIFRDKTDVAASGGEEPVRGGDTYEVTRTKGLHRCKTSTQEQQGGSPAAV